MSILTFQATLGGSVNLVGPNTSNTTSFTLPSDYGTNGQPLLTSSSGTLSFGTLGFAGGGTGLTSTPSNGQLDIGNGSGFTRTTLTAGSGISIANAAGSITITSTSQGGTVTSVGASVPSFLSVSGSPVTTSGTLAITYSGTALPVANGGTGATSLTANNVLLGNGTSAVQVVAPGTTGNVLTSNGTTWTSALSNGIVLGTPVATTSGTSFTFTGIPSNAKTIYVNFNGVTAGSAGSGDWIYVQIGPSGGVETSGYTSTSTNCQSNQSTQLSGVSNAFGAYSAFYNTNICGSFVISLENSSSNTWVSTTNLMVGSSVVISAGKKSLAGTLTQLKIFVNGSYTFSAGEINISYGT
jgi:hypothetical protein